MLDVVHVPTVRPLNDLLGVKHHISQENQEAEVELQQGRWPSMTMMQSVSLVACFLIKNTRRRQLIHLDHEGGAGVAKD